MKLLCLCSALDIQYRFGCTPNWWQFIKGLYELGHDVIAIPYHGTAFETPYWRAYPNPCRLEGQAFATAKRLFGSGPTSTQEGAVAKVSKALIDSWIRPRWERHIAGILEKEKDVDAVIVFTIPVNHFTGIPARLRERYGVPFFYFDGDVPASLPRFGGFASGFRIYDNADLSEYDGFMCNSEGGAQDLLDMGAKRVEPVHWGVDPELYAPLDIEPDRDVFFYGFGAEFREEWVDNMLTIPSRTLTEYSFAVGGRGFDLDLGNTVREGDVPFNVFRQACCRSRINLSITRQAHGTVFASSTIRPFELAAMGCCVVSGRYDGLETWFEMGSEMLMVQSADEAIDTYRRLLGDDAARKAMGQAARRRVLACHTHRQRAEQIAGVIRSL
ncbi:MAG: glycosyltransferase [Candidatus Hydrogenedentes bacterium]|nr:glycosyltransferase [Candidatus Hydrogenedentota bacterium]